MDGILYKHGKIYLDHHCDLVPIIIAEMYSSLHEGF